MVYKITFTHRALKDLDRISKDEKNKIGGKLKEYAQEPMKYARKFIKPKIVTYRFRVGDYRIIFDIEDNEIVVLRIGNRRDIYK